MPRNPNPWTQFHHFDFRNDDELALCSLAAQGLWIRVLCFMWANDTDRFEGSIEELAMIVRKVNTAEVEACSRELLSRGVCDGSVEGHGSVTLVSRRLSKSVSKRDSDRERKRRQREREAGHDDVTAKSPSDSVHDSDSGSSSGEEGSGGKGGSDHPGFDEFWAIYPRKTAKAEARKAWNQTKPNADRRERIAANISERLRVGDWSLDRKDVIPHAATYLRGNREDDELISRAGSNPSANGSGAPSPTWKKQQQIAEAERAALLEEIESSGRKKEFDVWMLEHYPISDIQPWHWEEFQESKQEARL